MHELSIEYGAVDSLIDPIDTCEADIEILADRVVETVEEVRTGTGNVLLKPIPYESFASWLCGGREAVLTIDKLKQIINVYNRKGISFMVPFNGGLVLPERETIDVIRNSRRYNFEREVLELLAENTARYDVENQVTVLRDDLLDNIRRHFSNLITVASCIKFVGGREGKFKGQGEYDEAFEKYDLVCPLNQHTNYDFLEQYIQNAHQIIAFLQLGCDHPNLHHCYEHYFAMEMIGDRKAVTKEELEAHPGYIPADEFTSIQSGLSLMNPEDQCIDDDLPLINPEDQCIDGELSSREWDLKELIRIGVNKFKVPRRTMFAMNTIEGVLIEKLIMLFSKIKKELHKQKQAYSH